MEPNTTLPKTKKLRQFIATITQTGTAQPITNVIKNDIGLATIVRGSVGDYYAISTVKATDVTIYVNGISLTVDGQGSYIPIHTFDVNMPQVGLITVYAYTDTGNLGFGISVKDNTGTEMELSTLIGLIGAPLSIPQINIYAS